MSIATADGRRQACPHMNGTGTGGIHSAQWSVTMTRTVRRCAELLINGLSIGWSTY